MNSEFEARQAAFNSKLEEVKSERASRKQQSVDKVNMALVHEKGGAFYLGSIFGQDAKIRPRNDGSEKIDVFFGGLNASGDGIGHGHAVIDRNGNVKRSYDGLWVRKS